MNRLLFLSFLLASISLANDLPDFDSQVLPILENRCGKCHGPDKQKGDVRFDTLSTNFTEHRAAAETWDDALNSIQLAEMPPDDQPQLTDAERKILTEWIEAKLDHALQTIRGEASGTVIRRLNRDEYFYTMQDLLGLEMNYRRYLPPDPRSHDGFLNNGQSLGMTAMQLEGYLRTAREALALVLVEGDRPVTRHYPVKDGFNLRGRKKKEGVNQDRLGRYHFWAGTTTGLHREGLVKVRIKAHAEIPEGEPNPTIFVQYGYFVSGLTFNFLTDLGEIVIDSTEPKTYEFTVRAELAPQPEANVPIDKLNSVVVIYNSLDDGKKPKDPIKIKIEGKKKRTQVTYPEDETFPKVIVDSVEIIGNHYAVWPPAEHRQIVPSEDALSSRSKVEQTLQEFFSRAWRKEPSSKEIERWVNHFFSLTESGSTDIESLREVLAAGLSSSDFLYLAEPTANGEDRYLNQHEIASRLSYFLWSSLPDSELLASDFANPESLLHQVDRLLADPKAERFLRHFADQWLDLEAVDRIAINPQFYRDFDETLKADMAEESRAFFAEIFRNDLPALNFLDSDFTMANAKLAKHYQIQGPKSQNFQRVSLVNTDRPGGLLGHGATHLAGSDGAHSHPIKRAVWLRERLLHDPPKPPPPNVPSLGEAERSAKNLTVREQLALHREEGACADCHQFIDPWGIAFEQWDAIGLKRKQILRTKQPVDARTELPGGIAIDGLTGLQNYLIKHRHEQFAEALTAKMLIYALGRSLELSDETEVEKIAQSFAAKDYQLRSLVTEIVTSDLFRKR